MLRDHHRRVVERLKERFGRDPDFPALIIGGSVAKGWAKDDSDVDIILVATDERYARARAEGRYGYFSTEDCDYPGGYVDGKIVDLQFLRDVAAFGSEPARAAFVGAFPAYSRLPEVDDLIARIPVYPEHEHQDRMWRFFGQVLICTWYVGEAEKRDDLYLLRRMSSELALFGGRLILACNKILYPYHKWLMTALRLAQDKPEHFLDLADALLREPGKASAEAFCACLANFRAWGMTLGDAANLFMEDSEWHWRSGRPPIQDC